ncbi:N-acetylglucosamine-1-phosphodiester alpha-N-acetylglucosaminidase isoform X2 [Rhinatrema bivittatum]|uniref:N-acetylglucosamine-1-phosphodiester alpha-N-acetylglucosaminidase isoform X2 n=1 Tax=Rhinatrema bivittatum TaxID=194408 RepID=UPI00112EA99A|nr:N-acetylglucosamine-1-phosphodiester alpha-N-acetylglucosaminidase isoform X2 [Rhinatrema bivittatum]
MAASLLIVSWGSVLRKQAKLQPFADRKRIGVRVLFLPFIILQYCARVSARNSLNDDLLLPYLPVSSHGLQHHRRFARDCQSFVYYNSTYETWSSNNNTEFPVATTRIFVSKFPGENVSQKTVYGHFTFVNNPLRTFSVVEPGGPGGCSSNRTATAEETAKFRRCLVAQNGGYFNVETGACLGNVISDGKLVHNAKGKQNAQFGIKADGTMVFGYVSEEDLLDKVNPFVHLLSGVVWLLRNGEIYVKQSKEAECDQIQTTGTFEQFINVISARTAVGHDQDGRLILFHVDGQTRDKGLNLWEMARFLKDQGVINAINLDGGGSATLILNGTLASYPSDHCVNPMWRCPRSISTIVCVHEPLCNPADCGGHGHCVLGKCQCVGFWSGPACSILDCKPLNCSLHGVCTQDGCLCDAGWIGSSCTKVCSHGFYGDGCSRECRCENGGTCDQVSGSCTCSPGYMGEFCEQECPIGMFGLKCQQRCQCENLCPCHRETGSCNVIYEAEVNNTLYKADQCLASIFTSFKEQNRILGHKFLTEQSWILLSTGLFLLLVISAMGNVMMMQYSRKEKHRHKYAYHRLEELNENSESLD